MIHRIGNFSFVLLEGLPTPPRQNLQLSTRPGVDGIEAVRLGRWGEPFSLRSVRDEPDYAAARIKAELYAAAVGDPPVELVLSGVSSLAGLPAFRVLVLEAAPLRIARTALQVGGLQAGSLAVVEAQWTLVAVE